MKALKDEIAFYFFGWGTRICLGQSIAMIKAKMALAIFLQHFSRKIILVLCNFLINGWCLFPAKEINWTHDQPN